MHRRQNLSTGFLFLATILAALLIAWSKGADAVGAWLACTVPLVLAILVLLAIAWLVQYFSPHQRLLRLQYYRWQHALCIQCGYDLRAHHPGEQCPECGTTISAK